MTLRRITLPRQTDFNELEGHHMVYRRVAPARGDTDDRVLARSLQHARGPKQAAALPVGLPHRDGRLVSPPFRPERKASIDLPGRELHRGPGLAPVLPVRDAPVPVLRPGVHAGQRPLRKRFRVHDHRSVHPERYRSDPPGAEVLAHIDSLGGRCRHRHAVLHDDPGRGQIDAVRG